MPAARGSTSGRPAGSLPEPMVPYPRCTNEIGVLSQRSQFQFGLFTRNESATLTNYFADAIKKKGRAVHHAATQDDHVWHKKIDQIGQTETQVVGFALNRSRRQPISAFRQLADLCGAQIFGRASISCRICVEPRGHRWSGRQRFPAASETTGTKRSGWVNNVMTNFGMGHSCATVKLSIEYDSAADTRADRDINQSRLTFSSAPACLPEGRSIRVVFQGHGHVENSRQIFHRVVPLP